MAALLAGLPITAPGVTVNRLCGSGMEAVGQAARAIKAGEGDLIVAGGVESMTRAPFVMPKADTAFSPRQCGLRHHHRLALRQPGDEGRATASIRCRRPPTTSPPITASPAPTRTPSRCAASSAGPPAQAAGAFARRDRAGARARKARASRWSSTATSIRGPTRRAEQLAKLKPLNGPDKWVTAGNASGVNDGAAALIVASEAAARRYGLTPQGARRRHGGGGRRAARHGRRPDARRRGRRSPARGLTLDQMDVIELNEAFAAQALAVLRELGFADDARPRQPQRRRHRDRPSARHERRAAGDDGDVSTAPPERPLRAMHDVHRRRPGHRAHPRKGVRV